MQRTPTRRKVLAGVVASAATTASVPSAIFASGSGIHEVEIERFKFQPDTLQVKVGDVIRWTNNDLAPHTASALEFSWDSESLSKGDSFELIVTADMETDYFCVFHPKMKGSFEIL